MPNVGIGTTSPNAKLDVSGSTQFNQSISNSITSTIYGNNNSTAVSASPNLVVGNLNNTVNSTAGINFRNYNSVPTAVNSAAIQAGLSTITAGAEQGFIRISTTTSGTLTEKMRIDSSGNVGIGTTSPSELLQVVGADDNHRIQVRNTSSTAARWPGFQVQTYTGGNGGAGIYHFKTARGTSAAQSELLSNDIIGMIQGYGAINTATQHGVAADIVMRADGNFGATSSPGRLEFNTTPSGSTATTTRMVINNTGYVGVGTTGPTHLLHVSGTPVGQALIRITGDNTGDNHIRYDFPSNTSKYWLVGSDRDWGSDFLWFNSNTGTVAMSINDATNNVAIGSSSSPSYRLVVEDTDSANVVAMFTNLDTSTTSDGIAIRLGPTANPGAGNQFVQFQDGDGTIIGKIEGTGGASVNYNTTSDRRLKENIVDTHYSIDDLLKVGVHDYNYLGSKVPMTGFMAQDLHKVFPQAVSKPEDESKEYWGVDYGKITPLIVKALQDFWKKFVEQTEKTDKLEQQVRQLASEVDRAREENRAMKAYLCEKDPNAPICAK